MDKEWRMATEEEQDIINMAALKAAYNELTPLLYNDCTTAKQTIAVINAFKESKNAANTARSEMEELLDKNLSDSSDMLVIVSSALSALNLDFDIEDIHPYSGWGISISILIRGAMVMRGISMAWSAFGEDEDAEPFHEDAVFQVFLEEEAKIFAESMSAKINK